MQLLRTHLDKEAKDLIKDLTLTNNNFKVAWSRLQNRYENKKVIVHQYLQKLITQPYRILKLKKVRGHNSTLRIRAICPDFMYDLPERFVEQMWEYNLEGLDYRNIYFIYYGRLNWGKENADK